MRFEALSDAWERLPAGSRVVTDEHVFAAWGASIPRSAEVFRIPPGEPSKSLDVYGECLRWMARSGADRQTVLAAFGGGVVGDLAGFVAATFMRGIRYVHIPTSLLAQVDSSVGGKVGLDLNEGKNLVGSFYPPSEVSVALETLETLRAEEFRNGMAEVWKYGFAVDASLLPLLESEQLSPKSARLSHIVERCIQLKANIVAEDEFDVSGRRAILNFGHTVGHALETLCGFRGLRHGEAVAIGMVAEAAIGERLGMTPSGVARQIATSLEADGLPTGHRLLTDAELIAAMRSDKKAEGGRIAVCLLEAVGECKLVPDVPESEIEAALSAL